MQLVSIVIPIYNSEKTLDRCIKSVVSQDYKNIEVILIDDGSRDDSSEICKFYLEQDFRIKYYFQENQGVSAARNFGIDIAKGDHILFIDSDDYIEKNMVSKLLKGVDLSVCGYDTYYIKQKEKVPYIRNFSGLNEKKMKKKRFLDHLGAWMISFNIVCMSWNKLFDLKKIKENKLYFPVKVSYGEDLIFNLNYFRIMKTIYFIPEVLYHYEVGNMASLEGKYKNEMFSIQKKQFNMILDVLESERALGYYNRKNIACYFIGRVEYSIRMLFHIQCKLGRKEKETKIENIIKESLVQDSLKLVWNTFDGNLGYFISCMKKKDIVSIMNMYSEIKHVKLEKTSKNITFYLEKIIQYVELIEILGISATLKKLNAIWVRDNEK